MNKFLCEFAPKENAFNGFTIVELVVVLSILSTLSAITIPNILRTIKLNRILIVRIAGQLRVVLSFP